MNGIRVTERVFRSARGFTLMEVVVSMIVFAIISILLVRIFGVGAEVYESIYNNKEMVDNIYLAQRRFSDDISSVRDIQHLLYGDRTSFRFITSKLDTIQYRYASGSLFRAKNSDGEFEIAQYLTDSTAFYYYTVFDATINEDPLTSSSLLSIWRVRLDIHATKGTQTVKIRSASFPGNFKYGVVKN